MAEDKNPQNGQGTAATHEVKGGSDKKQFPLIPDGNISDYTNLYRFVQAVNELMFNGETAKMLYSDPVIADDMKCFMPGNTLHLSNLVNILERHQNLFNFTKRMTKDDFVALYNYGQKIAEPGRQIPSLDDVYEAVKYYEDTKLTATEEAQTRYKDVTKSYNEAKKVRKKEGRKVFGHLLGTMGAGLLSLAIPATVFAGLVSLVTVPAVSLGWMTGGGIAIFAAGVIAVKYVLPKCFGLFGKAIGKLKAAIKSRKEAKKTEKELGKQKKTARAEYSACHTQEVIDKNLNEVTATRYPGKGRQTEATAENSDPVLNLSGYENVAAARARQTAQAQTAQPQATPDGRTAAESEFSEDELALFNKFESTPFMLKDEDANLQSFIDANKDTLGFNADTFADRYHEYKASVKEAAKKLKHDCPFLAIQCFDAIEGEPTEEQINAIYERTGYSSLEAAKAKYAKKKKISVDEINLDPAQGKQPNRPWLAKTISEVVGKEGLSDSYETRTGYADPDLARQAYAKQKFRKINKQVLTELGTSSWSEFTAKSPEETEELWKNLDEKQKTNLYKVLDDLSAEDAEKLLKDLSESLVRRSYKTTVQPSKGEEKIVLMNDKPEEMLILFDRYDKYLASQGRTWKGDDQLDSFINFMTESQGQDRALAERLYGFYKGQKQDKEAEEAENNDQETPAQPTEAPAQPTEAAPVETQVAPETEETPVQSSEEQTIETQAEEVATKEPITDKEKEVYERFVSAMAIKQNKVEDEQIEAQMFENFASRNRIDVSRSREIYAELSKTQTTEPEQQEEQAKEVVEEQPSESSTDQQDQTTEQTADEQTQSQPVDPTKQVSQNQQAASSQANADDNGPEPGEEE